MLTPRYYFTGEFCRFYDYFLSHPHTEKHFAKGEYLWRPGQPHEKIHYIKSGALMHYADHENGQAHFYVSDVPDCFVQTADLFLGEYKGGPVEQIAIDKY